MHQTKVKSKFQALLLQYYLDLWYKISSFKFMLQLKNIKLSVKQRKPFYQNVFKPNLPKFFYLISFLFYFTKWNTRTKPEQDRNLMYEQIFVFQDNQHLRRKKWLMFDKNIFWVKNKFKLKTLTYSHFYFDKMLSLPPYYRYRQNRQAVWTEEASRQLTVVLVTIPHLFSNYFYSNGSGWWGTMVSFT